MIFGHRFYKPCDFRGDFRGGVPDILWASKQNEYEAFKENQLALSGTGVILNIVEKLHLIPTAGYISFIGLK